MSHARNLTTRPVTYGGADARGQRTTSAHSLGERKRKRQTEIERAREGRSLRNNRGTATNNSVSGSGSSVGRYRQCRARLPFGIRWVGRLGGGTAVVFNPKLGEWSSSNSVEGIGHEQHLAPAPLQGEAQLP